MEQERSICANYAERQSIRSTDRRIEENESEVLMKVIYKYPIELRDVQFLEVPKRSQLLTAQLQHGRICIWAIVSTEEKETETRRIEIHGTGNPVAPGESIIFGLCHHLGSVQQEGFVWHVFAEIK